VGSFVRVFAALILCSRLASLLLSCSSQTSDAPQVVAVAVCPDLTPGMRRIPSDFGIRFDAPEKVFMVQSAVRDMPPGTMYVVKLRNGDAHIVVWRDDDVFRDLKIAFPIFSKHIEERIIRDTTGRNFGTDQWGYLQTGERWRYVKFSTGDAVGYEPRPPEEANLLDQVINSACFSVGGNPRK
jgi:hypothetical protein